MQIKSGNLNEYLKLAQEVSSANEHTPPYGMDFIQRLDKIFHRELFEEDFDLNLIAAPLAVNAYWLFLGGVRGALSGHPAGVFPIIRTAIESAYYCFLISKNAALGDVWLNRQSGDVGKKKCRSAFGQANADVQKMLSSDHPVMAAFIGEQYEWLIDWGAHPNPNSILIHLDVAGAGFNHVDGGLNFAGLYEAGTNEISDSLLTYSGGAIVIIFLIAASLKDHPLASKNNALIADLMENWLMIEHELSLELLTKINA